MTFSGSSQGYRVERVQRGGCVRGGCPGSGVRQCPSGNRAHQGHPLPATRRRPKWWDKAGATAPALGPPGVSGPAVATIPRDSWTRDLPHDPCESAEPPHSMSCLIASVALWCDLSTSTAPRSSTSVSEQVGPPGFGNSSLSIDSPIHRGVPDPSKPACPTRAPARKEPYP